VNVVSPGVAESELAEGISEADGQEEMKTFRRVAISAAGVARAIAYATEQQNDVDVSEMPEGLPEGPALLPQDGTALFPARFPAFRKGVSQGRCVENPRFPGEREVGPTGFEPATAWSRTDQAQARTVSSVRQNPSKTRRFSQLSCGAHCPVAVPIRQI
jgi:hypothetical protein